MNFKERYLAGEIPFEEIDRYIEEWNNSDDPRTLAKFLGLDEEEEDEPPRRSSRGSGRTQPSRAKSQRGGYKPKNFADMDEDDDLDFEFLDLK